MARKRKPKQEKQPNPGTIAFPLPGDGGPTRGKHYDAIIALRSMAERLARRRKMGA